jgi:hypothetical protein
MSNAQLPERPSLEFLKKLAKERLETLRRTDPKTKLAEVLLALAREYGFSSWRALKARIEQQRRTRVSEFLEACQQGDLDLVQKLLTVEPELAHARDDHGSTGLHAAAARNHSDIVGLLLRHGVDPNTRDAGDNATPLHFAAVVDTSMSSDSCSMPVPMSMATATFMKAM